MIKKIIHILLLIIAFDYALKAQVELIEPIKLTNADSTKRQVINLGFPEQLSGAVNANTYQTNYLLLANVAGTNDSLDLSFKLDFQKYYLGMSIYFIATATNRGPLYIKTGTLPYKEVLVFQRSLDSGEIIQNRLINLMYNGTNFEMLTQPNKPCPKGFVAMNKNYCIEAQEHDTITFFNAVIDCADMNARICTWSEWYYACNKAVATGLTNMTGNFEWIDDAGNYTSNLGAKTVGNIDCNDSYSEYPLLKRAYRCCYSR